MIRLFQLHHEKASCRSTVCSAVVSVPPLDITNISPVQSWRSRFKNNGACYWCHHAELPQDPCSNSIYICKYAITRLCSNYVWRIKLWIVFGSSGTSLLVRCASLGPQNPMVLPVFHTLTGRDTLSQFYECLKANCMREKCGILTMDSLELSLSYTVHHGKYLKWQKMHLSTSQSCWALRLAPLSIK